MTGESEGNRCGGEGAHEHFVVSERSCDENPGNGEEECGSDEGIEAACDGADCAGEEDGGENSEGCVEELDDICSGKDGAYDGANQEIDGFAE